MYYCAGMQFAETPHFQTLFGDIHDLYSKTLRNDRAHDAGESLGVSWKATLGSAFRSAASISVGVTGTCVLGVGAGVEVRKSVEQRPTPFFPSFGDARIKCEAASWNGVQLGPGLPKSGIGRGV